MRAALETLGRYQILGELGRGACGVVYSAIDSRIGRKVAIKSIHSEFDGGTAETFRERLRREARSAGILAHPNIVTVYELDEIDQVTFIVMEFVEGQTLAQKMQGEPLPLEFALHVLRQTADALDFAHSNDIIHRDVKPANIMVTSAGFVKVADFGIAKVLHADSNLTKTGMVLGTVYYMAPEQLRDEDLSGRADQFALGVIAYEMLTGRRPFEAGSMGAVVHQIVSAEPPAPNRFRASLGDSVTLVLQRALAKSQAKRYSSCREFVDELSRAVLDTTVEQAAPAEVASALKSPMPPMKELPETRVPPARTPPDAASLESTKHAALDRMVNAVEPVPVENRGRTVLGPTLEQVAPRGLAKASKSPRSPVKELPETRVLGAVRPQEAATTASTEDLVADRTVIAAEAIPVESDGAPAVSVVPDSLEPPVNPPSEIRSPSGSQSRAIPMIAAAAVVVLLGVFLAFRSFPAGKSPAATSSVPTGSVPAETSGPAPHSDAAPAPLVADSSAKEPVAAPKASRPVVQAKQPVSTSSRKDPAGVAYTFNTNPSGADVTLDNNPALKCTSPCVATLATGRHSFVAHLGGYREAEGVIELPRDTGRIVDLVQMSGRLSLLSNPPGLSIAIDGQPQAQKTPAIFTLPAGRHHIEVTKGSEKQELDVDVPDGSFRSQSIAWN